MRNYVTFGVVLALMLVSLPVDGGASLIFSYSFWTSLSLGSVALVMLVELGGGRWLDPVRHRLLSLHSLLIPLAISLILLYPFVDELYPWVGRREGPWFDPRFFILRNVVFILLSYITARLYVNTGKQRYAVLYLLSASVAVSLLAFDVIMSLEYPWISTLFGGYMAISSLYAGSALGSLFYSVEKNTNKENVWKMNTFCSAFSIPWAYAVYFQYMLIWIANISEEVSFLLKRTETSPFRELSVFTFLLLFVVPFTILIIRRVKTSHLGGAILSSCVLCGLILQFAILCYPSAKFNVLMSSFIFVAYLFHFVVNLKVERKLITFCDTSDKV